LAADKTSIAAQAVNGLGLDLLAKATDANSNALLSPYSIQTAMEMVYAGADGDTRTQMAKVLHYPQDERALHQSFGALQELLATGMITGEITSSYAGPSYVELTAGPAVHAAELARLTGFKPRTMQLLLQEMALSGHVLTQEPPSRPPDSTGRGSSRRYHLQAGDWAFLTGGKPLPRWIPWTPLWRIVQDVLDALIEAGESPKHSALLSSRFRESLATQGQELAAAGLLPLLDLRSTAPGSEILTTLSERLPKVLEKL